MATYYWVGGTGTWDSSTTTHWASSSGGAANAGVPTSADNVIFDTLSGTGTVSVVGSSGVCFNFTVTATQALGFSASLGCYGSMALPSGGSTTFSALNLSFLGTTTGLTISTNGKTVGAPTFNGAGGSWTLSDAFNCGILLIQGGTFNSGNFAITASSIGRTSTSTTTVINLGSSNISIGANGVNFSATTGLTFNVGTSTITTSANTFTGGNLTYYNVIFTSTSTSIVITGANNFNGLTLPTTSSGIQQVSLGATQTATTFSANGSAVNARLFVYSGTAGTRTSIVASTTSISNVDFLDIQGSGGGTWSGTSIGNCGNNTGITFTTAKTVYWNLAGSQVWNAIGWCTASGGTPATGNFPLAQDTAIIDQNSSISTLTVNYGWNVGTLDMSLRTSAMTFANGITSLYIYGNLLLGTGVTLTGTGTIYINGRTTTQTITSNGRTFSQYLQISNYLGTTQLADNLLSSNTINIVAGTFNTNNYNITATTFSSSNSNTRVFNLGSSTITLTSTGTIWNTGTTTGLTFNAGTSNIVISDSSASQKIIGSGVLTFYTITIGGGASTSIVSLPTVSGSTINTIASTRTGSYTIQFIANYTINNWQITGTAGNIVTINTSVLGSQKTITYTGGLVSMDYMSFTDISFSYTLGASNPYIVYAGANSTNGGNNNGILFQSTAVKAYQLTTGTSWTVPSDWNNSNNTIHLIGGGAGGIQAAAVGSNRAAGGGGGGGGYRVLTNQTLSGSIPYTIGTGGSAGANGGNTTFNTTNIAGGGQTGTATTTPSSSGGAGGTGTYAGGAGGAGAFGTTASQGYGSGGGGGAGGPNGVGGAGGNGFASTTSANVAGGGGGGNGGGSAGGNASSAVGGTGGNNFSGTGGGATNGAKGTLGGGGAGGATGTEGAGGSGKDIANTIGGGGGMGGMGSVAFSVFPGSYGGGGCGGYVATTGGVAGGFAGTQGVIFIIYTPSTNNSGFFFLF
jgi:hypothetical protein